MKKIAILIGVLIGTFIVRQGVAQTIEETCKNELQKLGTMVGEWEGGGWYISPDRVRSEFTQREIITYDLNGTVLMIHGTGSNDEMKPIHNALGIISFDATTSSFIMNSFLEDGKQVKATLEILESGQIKWWFKTEQGGTVKYLITLEDNKWNEKGEYSPNGEVWFPFIEFSLMKKQ